jgi:hypothetical protein
MVCSTASAFRNNDGCDTPITTWPTMPSSLVFSTDTRPSWGFGSNADDIG